MRSDKRWWIREFVPPNAFLSNPDYVAACSLRSLRSSDRRKQWRMLEKKKHPLSEPSTDRSPLQSLFLGRKSLLDQIWLEHRLPYISFANKMVVDISRFPQKNENKNVKRKITQDATLFKTFYRRKKILKRKKENMNVPREVTPLQLDTS